MKITVAKIFDKYGMPILMAVISLTFCLRYFSFYTDTLYHIISEIIVIFFCVREYLNAYIKRKCIWQKGSILCVIIYCLVNILFYVTDWNEEIIKYNNLALLLSAIFVYIKIE